jgi:hypothetical protein
MIPPRRFLFPALFLFLLGFLFTAHKFDITPNAVATTRLQELANNIGDHVPGLSKEPDKEDEKQEAERVPGARTQTSRHRSCK